MKSIGFCVCLKGKWPSQLKAKWVPSEELYFLNYEAHWLFFISFTVFKLG